MANKTKEKTLSKNDLKGKVAVVVGGAGLLGPVVAEGLLDAGAKVILADIDESKLISAAQKISKPGRKVWSHKVDVADPASVCRLRDWLVDKFGSIDVLVNTVIGVGQKHFASLENYSWQDWNHVMKVSVGGIFLTCQTLGELMKKKGGSIINFGSIYGVVAPDQSIYGNSGINSPAVYGASKAAVIQFSKYLAVYWASHRIRVNCISPGGVANGQDKKFVALYSKKSPMGRMIEKEELKGAVLFLASMSSSSVTGQNLMVDGGWTAW